MGPTYHVPNWDMNIKGSLEPLHPTLMPITLFPEMKQGLGSP